MRWRVRKNELTHYGVKGMKWGVRHDRKRSGRKSRATRLEGKIEDVKKVIKSFGKKDYSGFDEVPLNKIYDVNLRYDSDGTPYAFALGMKHERKGKQVVDISVGVSPNKRRSGVASDMVKELIETINDDSSVSDILWGAEKSNSASIQMAKKLGFEHDYDTDYYTVWKKSNRRG